MSAFLNDVKFVASTAGLTDFTVASVVATFQSPNAAGAVDGTIYSYTARTTTQFESGTGAYTASTQTIARTNILSGTGGAGAKVDFSTPPTVIITALNNDLAPVFNVQGYGWYPDGTDHSTEMLAILVAMDAAGGGTMFFPASAGTYRADSQMFIPNDGGVGGNQPTQKNFRITGSGGGANLTVGPQTAGYGTTVNASVLDLRFSGVGDGNAKIETRGFGALYIDNLLIIDGSVGNTTPLIHTTNTTLTIERNCFVGSGTATQDAIVLGGSSTTITGTGVNNAFQGYGTTISNNIFANLNRCAYLRTFAFGVKFSGNQHFRPSGTIAVESDGGSGNPPEINAGNYIFNNSFELSGSMVYGIKLTATRHCMFDNTFDDLGANVVARYGLFASAPNRGCYYNLFYNIYNPLGSLPFIAQTGDAQQLTQNSVIGTFSTKPIAGFTGVISTEFANGVLVKGFYDNTKQYAGPLVIASDQVPAFAVSIGPDGSGKVFIDALTTAGAEQSIALNPRGGAVSTGTAFIIEQTTNHGLSVTESSYHFSNIGANAEVDFTLPSDPTAFDVSGTPYYYFHVDAAQTVKIISAGAANVIRVGNTVSAVNGNITSNVVGSTIKLTAGMGNPSQEWFAEAVTGNWIVT